MSPKAEFTFAIVMTVLAGMSCVAAVYHSAWTVLLVSGCIMVAGIVVAFRAAMMLMLR